jgi:hypothetical protein
VNTPRNALQARKIILVAVIATIIVMPGLTRAQLTHHGLKAEDFIEYITVADPYSKWQMWPGTGKLHEGKSPHGHGALVSIYVNRAAYRSIGEKKGMADGSIIVVENYDSGKNLTGLTTMYKVNGYNRGAADWYWMAATPEGKAQRSGKVQPCIDCHTAQAKNDYIWTGEVVGGQFRTSATP